MRFMSKKTRVVIYLDLGQLTALQSYKERTGASIAELCRRAVDAWIKTQQGRKVAG